MFDSFDDAHLRIAVTVTSNGMSVDSFIQPGYYFTAAMTFDSDIDLGELSWVERATLIPNGGLTLGSAELDCESSTGHFGQIP